MLYTKCYISNSVDLWNKSQLESLFLFSKTQNLFQNITGLLLYNGGTFLQVFEGEKDILDSLLSKVKLDNRHNHIIVMMDKPIKNRLFKSFQTALVSSGNEKDMKRLKSKIYLPKTSRYARGLRAILDSFTLIRYSISGYGV